MTKFLSTLMIGVTLVGAAPAFAGNTADIIQKGKVNTIEAEQRGRDNSFASAQEGLDNLLKLKQRGRNNSAEAFQDGDVNVVDLDQARGRRPAKCGDPLALVLHPCR